jgi:hypothetical protein
MNISGYLGRSDQLDEPIGAFSPANADQAERNDAALGVALRKSKITAYWEA